VVCAGDGFVAEFRGLCIVRVLMYLRGFESCWRRLETRGFHARELRGEDGLDCVIVVCDMRKVQEDSACAYGGVFDKVDPLRYWFSMKARQCAGDIGVGGERALRSRRTDGW
jgi:hypothetical protein